MQSMNPMSSAKGRQSNVNTEKVAWANEGRGAGRGEDCRHRRGERGRMEDGKINRCL